MRAIFCRLNLSRAIVLSSLLLLFGISSAEAAIALKDLIKFSRIIPTSAGQQQAIKLVYQRQAIGAFKLNFVDTKRYNYHIEYATAELGYRGDSFEFNKNYSGPIGGRDFVLATLSLQNSGKSSGPTASPDLALFELWSGDTLDSDGLKHVMSLLKAQLPASLTLKFHPLSLEQESLARRYFSKDQIIFTKDLIGDRDFISLNNGEAVGYLRFFASAESAEAQANVDMRTIAVFDQVPNDVGLCSGVITAEPQTPLSHVNVKAINRRTINFFLKNAKEKLKAYENQPVRIKVTSGGYEVTTFASRDEAENAIKAFWDTRRPAPLTLPAPDLDPKLNSQLVPLTRYYSKLPDRATHSKLIRTVGAKAANIALLHAMVRGLPSEKIVIPEAYGIPFNFYEMFINRSQKGLDSSRPDFVTTPKKRTEEILAKAGLLNTNEIHDADKAAPVLAEIRKMISKAEVPPELLKVLKHEIMENSDSPVHQGKIPRIRLRSSTNSEDLEGFSGAGLYDSDGVNLYKKLKPYGYDKSQPKAWSAIEKDLKEVIPFLYAGVWNDRAFFEREWYSMNGTQHFNVKVGLALHGAFPRYGFGGEDAEVANGVSVTANIYKPQEEGKVYINSQHYDLAVTNPPEAKDLEEAGEDPKKPYSTEELVITTFVADPSEDNMPDSWTKWAVEKVRSSSVKGGAEVLKIENAGHAGGDEARRLAKAMEALNKSMARVYGADPWTFDIDVEWKIYGPQRDLVIKQVRPFLPPEQQASNASAAAPSTVAPSDPAARANGFAPPSPTRSQHLQSGPRPPKKR